MKNKQQPLKLKRCPFCGGKAAWSDGEQKTKYGNEQVYCTNCWCITAPEGSKEEAAANWNTRTANRVTNDNQ